MLDDIVSDMKDMTSKIKLNLRDGYTEQDEKYINKALHVMTVNMSKFIVDVMDKGGVSARELSRRTGVSIAVISDTRGMKYLPKLEVLMKLAYGCNLDFNELFEILWNELDSTEWNKLTGVPINNYKAILSDIVTDALKVEPLDEILAKEGLTKNDVKEVLEFIEFKKSRQKRR